MTEIVTLNAEKKTVDTLEQEMLNDPSTSFWLKEQIKATKQRDLLDALNDAEALVLVLKSRLALIL